MDVNIVCAVSGEQRRRRWRISVADLKNGGGAILVFRGTRATRCVPCAKIAVRWQSPERRQRLGVALAVASHRGAAV